MTHDISNLHAAVKANLTDITARLALADAYEEQGNDSAAREQRTLANLTEEDRISALAKSLETSEEGIGTLAYLDNCFNTNGGEYLVLTDEEADKLAAEEILDSVWTFNADFLVMRIRVVNAEIIATEKTIKAVQEKCSEDCNGLLRAALTHEDEFVRDAIRDDGRGFFLAGYDHDENEVQYNGATLYIYRIN